MIGLLRGKLIEKRPNQVLLDVGGVGYQVLVPLSTFAGLGALHAETTLLIHTHVREDALALYGFVTAREKQCFELLISASGVGPSLALKILSGMSIEQLVPAIRKGDLVQLVRIPGVGRKTAERIVVELRDKLAAVDVPEAGKPATRSQLEADVASALVNLGYDERSVERAIEKARETGGADFEKLLRGALQILGSSAMQKSARAGRDE
jgi:holliday junction DNA helicase RuvA